MIEDVTSTSARHRESALRRTRSRIGEWRRRVAGWLPIDDWLVVGWAIGAKVLLLLFGVVSYQALEDENAPFGWDWLAIWSPWDALHFLRIAEFGYSAADTF